MDHLVIFIIVVSLVFVLSLSWFILETRLSGLKNVLEIQIQSVRDHIHYFDRKYYEHRKAMNSRIGVLEEKIGHLDGVIDVLKLEKERAKIEEELNSVKRAQNKFKISDKKTRSKR